MKNRIIPLIIASSLLMAGSSLSLRKSAYSNSLDPDKMLIVLAAPSVNERYYAEVFEQVIAFDIAYAQVVMGHDNIIVLADADTLPYLQGELPDDILLESEIADIWMRDFSTVLPSKMVQFRYQPSYLRQSDSGYIQASFNRFTSRHGLEYTQSELIIDGGNIVDNNADKVIFTERVLDDNPEYNQAEIIEELKTVLGVAQVAIIPQEEDEPMGHADGIAMFISKDTVLVNTYGEPFRSQVLAALQQGLPDTEIIEVEADYSLEIWKDFVSACGINVNATVTEGYIYMPTFGNENDRRSLDIMEAHSDKEVIPIDAQKVCFMGGSVRCLSWQVSGENAASLILAARQ
jgi:agmatine/peptidylarginine deiminase